MSEADSAGEGCFVLVVVEEPNLFFILNCI